MPRNWIVRERHPFDDGYWARYDGKRRPNKSLTEKREGWEACDREIAEEAHDAEEAVL
ncbi:hypothetical protein [Bradyrhizobium embrapense]|uniref:hypothetical protein n=1 Tax=Bradyrhizobium embrapense TaxID=630921 RepID=UPI000A4F1093|nr:hypothetical protein [Bradyrhizobium embrapense]